MALCSDSEMRAGRFCPPTASGADASPAPKAAVETAARLGSLSVSAHTCVPTVDGSQHGPPELTLPPSITNLSDAGVVPPGFRVASGSGNVIPEDMHSSSHSAEAIYVVNGQELAQRLPSGARVGTEQANQGVDNQPTSKDSRDDHATTIRAIESMFALKRRPLSPQNEHVAAQRGVDAALRPAGGTGDEREARKRRRRERRQKWCRGCAHVSEDGVKGHPSQKYHMEPGGCMFYMGSDSEYSSATDEEGSASPCPSSSPARSSQRHCPLPRGATAC